MLATTLLTLGSQVQGWQAWATKPRLFAFGDGVLLCVSGWPHTWGPQPCVWAHSEIRQSGHEHIVTKEKLLQILVLELTAPGQHPRSPSSCSSKLHDSGVYKCHTHKARIFLPACRWAHSPLTQSVRPAYLQSRANKFVCRSKTTQFVILHE